MPRPEQVILVVVDGLRPDALSPDRTPVLQGLIAAGAWSPEARAVRPSISLPCHTSIFCGVPPERHGIVANVWVPPQPPILSLIDVAYGAGLRTAAFYSWEELRDLARPGSLDLSYYRRRSAPEADGDLELATVAASWFTKVRPNVCFLYLGAADEVGHSHGWMSAAYLDTVAADDRAIGLLQHALEAGGCLDSTAFVVLADHGGHGYDHGEGTAEDLVVPWIASGCAIRAGHSIAPPISIVDTAPTVAHLLGLPIPSDWTGRVLSEVMAG